MKSGQIDIQDLLIKGFAEAIITKVKDYLKANRIEEDEIEINTEIIKSDKPYEIEVLTRVYRKENKVKIGGLTK